MVLMVPGCQPPDLPDPDPETVSDVSHHGIRIEVLDAVQSGEDLIVDFLITEDNPKGHPAYRIRMPWFVESTNGSPQESSHTAFYSVLDEEGQIVPGKNHLQVTFRNFSSEADFLNFEAILEPLFLVPSQDGYAFEVLLEEMIVDAEEPIQSEQLGFALSGSARIHEEDSLAVTVRIEADDALLQSMNYPLQPTGTDNLGRLYVSNRSRREPEESGFRQETLIFDDFDPAADSFTLRYPVQVQGTLPAPISYHFTDIPFLR